MGFIEFVNETLTSNFGKFGPLLAVGLLGLFLVLLTLPVLLKKREDPLDKLRRSTRATSSKVDITKQTLRMSKKNDKLEKYSNLLEPQDEEEYSAMRLKLLQAGYPSKNAVRTYNFAQFALGLGMLALGAMFAIANTINGDPSTQSLILMVLLPGCAGYMLPKYWVSRRQQSRQEEITNGFPDALDMMLVCVEAGQSLDQSIIRVAQEIRAGFPALADKFEIDVGRQP